MNGVATFRMCERAESAFCKRIPQLSLAGSLEVDLIGQQNGITRIDHRRRRRGKLQSVDHDLANTAPALCITELLNQIRSCVPKSFHPDFAVRMDFRSSEDDMSIIGKR